MARARAAAQVAGEGGVDAVLGVEREALDLSAAARQPQIHSSQRLAVKSDDGADFDVEIEIGDATARLGVGRGAAHDGFDEAAAVVDVGAHRHFERALRHALGLEACLVALGHAERREVGGDELAVGVELDGSLHRDAAALDDDVVDPRRRALAGAHGEGRARRLRLGLHPAGKQIVDLGLAEVGLDREPVVLIAGRRDLAAELDRNRPGHGAIEIETEAIARGVVECRLQAKLGIAVAARLAIVDHGRHAADAHVAARLVALRVGGHAQRLRLDALRHHEIVDGEIGDVGGDVVVHHALRHLGIDRHRQRDLGGHRAFAARRVERRARGLAQAIHREQFRGGRDRPLDPHARARRRLLDLRIRNLEDPVRHRQTAA